MASIPAEDACAPVGATEVTTPNDIDSRSQEHLDIQPTTLHDERLKISASALSSLSAASSSPTLALFGLAGKTALITGANGGIGGGISQALAELGADIIILQMPGDESPRAQDLRQTAGRQVHVYDCDLAVSGEIRKVVKRITDEDGFAIDILVNCAGMSGGSVPILKETDEHKDKVLPKA
jgi:hypothetical protein